MDWLLPRQNRIEKALASRHLGEGSLVLYDPSSSYFEGKQCPLAKLGHNRDGKKGKLQTGYGLLCNGAGTPVAIEVFEGDTAEAFNNIVSRVLHKACGVSNLDYLFLKLRQESLPI